MPMTRIVFDQGMNPNNYSQAVQQIQPVSYIMGQIADSTAMKSYNLDSYKTRTTQYLDAFGTKIDVWEVGNELNGGWLGNITDVTDKTAAAYDLVKARGYRAAITLNWWTTDNCSEGSQYDILTYAKNNTSAAMKQGLDYVLVSYYEDNCKYRPSASEVNTLFNNLHSIFPNAKIGFGEVGTPEASGYTDAHKTDLLNYYYKLNVNAPNYIGGYYWWYFAEDMVPSTKTLWTTLNNAIK